MLHAEIPGVVVWGPLDTWLLQQAGRSVEIPQCCRPEQCPAGFCNDELVSFLCYFHLFSSALSEQWAGKGVAGGDSYLTDVAFRTLVSRGWRNRKKNHVLLSWDSNPSSCRFDGNESIIRRYEPDFSTLWFNTNHLWHLAFVWFGEETVFWYTPVNKNPSAWNFLSPKPEVTCGTFAIIFRVVLLSPYLRIRAVSLSSIHYNQSHRVYINRRRQYICLIWN